MTNNYFKIRCGPGVYDYTFVFFDDRDTSETKEAWHKANVVSTKSLYDRTKISVCYTTPGYGVWNTDGIVS